MLRNLGFVVGYVGIQVLSITALVAKNEGQNWILLTKSSEQGLSLAPLS